MAARDQGESGGSEPWWRPQTVAAGETLVCRLGPLSLQVHHGPGEWQVAFAQGDEREADACLDLHLRRGGIEGDDYERFVSSA